MKNILKTISVLVSASLISVVAKAGALEVTGSATATYLINGGQNSSGKAIGISNELMFSASGELDNGFTWKYHTELDMADGGAASNDDTALVIGLGDLGTVGIYDAEGGLSTELGFGIGAVGVGQDYANTMTRIGMGSDVSAEAHVAYYTPAGLLPFGVEVAAGFAPNTADGQGNSAKNSGLQADEAITGTQATQYRVSAAPIDGLKIGADYFEVGGEVRELFLQQASASTLLSTELAFLAGTNPGKWMADLNKLAQIRLNDAGVLNISSAEVCTYCDAERFYSYRREKETGRLSSLIWLL